jgi:hypothetical protein
MKTNAPKKANAERLESYVHLHELFAPLESFRLAHPYLSPLEFEHYSTHELILFSVAPSLDFDELEKRYARILLALPSIKRIFAKPIINLTDTSEVLPVELVHIINQESLHHLANHTEDLEDLTDKGIKPRELLTRVYEDDYGIYENLVFCNLVDSILSFAHHEMSALRDLVYAKESLEFNLLERANHLNYFLTIGKLHTGYIRDFDKYYVRAKDLYGKLASLVKALESRKNKPIYQKNKARNKRLPLKKTNIFLNQKDYHAIYRLAKELQNASLFLTPEKEEIPEEDIQKEYFHFVTTLTLFALTNFNFDAEEGASFSLDALQSSFVFGPWRFSLEDVQGRGLLLKAHKDKDYAILLLPLINSKSKNNPCKTPADEVIIATPFEEDSFYSGIIYLTMESIDSFRRLQQLFLKAMIYSDTARDVCPFCGGALHYSKENEGYECESCHTLISEGECEETGEKYFYTSIVPEKKSKKTQPSFDHENPWLFHRQVEGSMAFRNITRINEKGEILCPFCGKIHK